MSSKYTCGLRMNLSAMPETHLRIEASSSRVPVLILEQELIHDEHSQGNELPLGHVCDGDLCLALTSGMQALEM